MRNEFKINLVIFLCLTFFITSSSVAQQKWRGIVVEPEHRCSPYNKKEQYPYPQSVEDEIVSAMGGYIYGPYSGRYFTSDTQTDIEHIVATSEGHDSGLCSASNIIRKQFASDILNLTLASPVVNRCGANGKCGLDAAEWMPEKNKCWFANRIVQIKTKYNLSVNQSEAIALESELTNCETFDMVFFSKNETEIDNTLLPLTNNKDALALYDDNKNGRITCAEARAHSITPVMAGHPAYDFMNDRNNDGIVCN